MRECCRCALIGDGELSMEMDGQRQTPKSPADNLEPIILVLAAIGSVIHIEKSCIIPTVEELFKFFLNYRPALNSSYQKGNYHSHIHGQCWLSWN